MDGYVFPDSCGVVFADGVLLFTGCEEWPILCQVSAAEDSVGVVVHGSGVRCTVSVWTNLFGCVSWCSKLHCIVCVYEAIWLRKLVKTLLLDGCMCCGGVPRQCVHDIYCGQLVRLIIIVRSIISYRAAFSFYA